VPSGKGWSGLDAAPRGLQISGSAQTARSQLRFDQSRASVHPRTVHRDSIEQVFRFGSAHIGANRCGSKSIPVPRMPPTLDELEPSTAIPFEHSPSVS